MSLTLYFVRATRSTRPRWMLEELGLPYELKKLDVEAGENKQAGYLAIHPLGKVPAIVEDGVPMFESAAIILQLADKHADKGLAPELGTRARGEYYQWILYTMASAEPHLTQLATLLHAPQKDEAAIAEARKRARDYVEVYERALKGREFIAGDRFSAADIVVSSVFAWARMMGLTEGLSAFEAYAQKHLQRPAAKRAREG